MRRRPLAHDPRSLHLLAQVRKNNAYLIVVNGGSVGKMFKLTGQEMTIGRSSEAEIQITDEGVSRRHAKIVLRR